MRRATAVKYVMIALWTAATLPPRTESGEPVPAPSTPFRLEYVDRYPLDAPLIGGKPARIHTQGLFVTEASFYVTGRVDSATPRRALFLRYDRSKPSRVEYVDITPALAGAEKVAAALDHPGGFDFDGESFWIPVAVSKPHSKTVVVRIRYREKAPLSEYPVSEAFQVEDHIGALAFNHTTKTLYGANWDTRQILHFNLDGTVLERIEPAAIGSPTGSWSLAVQDWKGVDNGRVLAGGIDKSKNRPPTASRSVVDFIDVANRKLLQRVRLPNPPDRQVTLTREGLALFGEHLYFLPGDLGRGAEVYSYRIRAVAKNGHARPESN